MHCTEHAFVCFQRCSLREISISQMLLHAIHVTLPLGASSPRIHSYPFRGQSYVNMASTHHTRSTSAYDQSIDLKDPETKLQNGLDADAALDFLQQKDSITAEHVAVDEKKLVRKIDWMVVPLMWCCYCLQYLDKTLSTKQTIWLLLTVESNHHLPGQLCRRHGSRR